MTDEIAMEIAALEAEMTRINTRLTTLRQRSGLRICEPRLGAARLGRLMMSTDPPKPIAPRDPAPGPTSTDELPALARRVPSEPDAGRYRLISRRGGDSR